MKKYIEPQVEIISIELERLVALSIQTGPADPNGDILVKEKEDWNIWN